ncbi:hypothetical protein [Acidisphaera sp. S103]|uniref:hypothetical protein n=1 Tax=Acidisphaera sp. S103 TaxID=1747223 RepID=UPI00131B43D7|nr:hypothetical protein [Acidisphaera sp. S103]
MNEQRPEGPASRPELHLASEPRYARRLSDKILIACHHACDQREIEIAADLLDVLEFMISRRPTLPTGKQRRAKESLVAAHERLWQMRHPTAEHY